MQKKISTVSWREDQLNHIVIQQQPWDVLAAESARVTRSEVRRAHSGRWDCHAQRLTLASVLLAVRTGFVGPGLYWSLIQRISEQQEDWSNHDGVQRLVLASHPLDVPAGDVIGTVSIVWMN